MTFLFFFLIFQNTLHLKFRSSYMEEVKSSYSKTPLQQRPYNQKVQRPSGPFTSMMFSTISTATKDLGKSHLSCNRIWLLGWIFITISLVDKCSIVVSWFLVTLVFCLSFYMEDGIFCLVFCLFTYLGLPSDVVGD